MTIKEKAERYDELLKKLQEAKEDNNVCDERYCCVIDDIVPELEEGESEDEKIRKKLIEVVKGDMVVGGTKDKQLAIAWLEKQGEQKHVEWSEEDKDMLRMLLEMINYASDHYQHDDKATDIKAWVLKSLKDKVQPQPKQEWSEEDKSMLCYMEGHLEYLKNDKGYSSSEDQIMLKRQLGWLKSLKDRYTWKPSEEQIGALEHFIRSIGESGYASPHDNNTKLVYSLLSELKKLRGE